MSNQSTTEPIPTTSLDFKRLFEAAPGLYLILAPDFTILGASDAYLRATMTVREDILGRGLFEVFPDNPDDAAATGVGNLRASLERVLHGRVPDTMAVQKYDVRRPASEGGAFEERYWSPINSPVFGDEGAIVYIIHRVEDVTEFLRLKEQEQEQGQLTAGLQSRAVELEAEVFARAQELQAAHRQLERAHADLERTNAELVQLTIELEDRVKERTAKLEKKNDEVRNMSQQLWQTAKLATMGELAASIAHELNNPLATVSLRVESLEAQLPEDHQGQRALGIIEGEVDRMAGLVARLLEFSRRSDQQISTVDLSSEVDGTLDLVQNYLKNRQISVVVDRDQSNLLIHADRQQLRQVLLNLITNASDAMAGQGGGTLTIQLRREKGSLNQSESSQPPGSPPGGVIVLEVADTGAGIAPENLTRVMEPFFTTKEEGKGTGLGLAICRRIIEEHDGLLKIDSEVNKGTTVRVALPSITNG